MSLFSTYISAKVSKNWEISWPRRAYLAHIRFERPLLLHVSSISCVVELAAPLLSLILDPAVERIKEIEAWCHGNAGKSSGIYRSPI